MADWRKLAKELLLADGKIDDGETRVIRQELMADAKIDDQELEFLLELKRSASGVAVSFNLLIIEAIKKNILEDGRIAPGEAEWLRRWIFADGVVTPPEKKLLQELKAGAKQTCPEFESLYQKCMAM
ncbi:MAG: TerB family tellurite resistance protein [Gemmataceae bacterium]|nr:TerB family tellurite resistance protein [Gemmataceae bacterium]